MQQITENDRAALNSVKLMKFIINRQFSQYTEDRILQILRPLRDKDTQHDQMVIKVLDILENNTTEDEILKKLKELT